MKNRRNRSGRPVAGVVCIHPDEHVIRICRPAWRYYVRWLILPFFLLPFLGAKGGESLIAGLVVTGLFILYSRYSNIYIITTKRVVQQTGLISRHLSQSCLKDILLIEISQGMADRILGTGRLLMESAAHSSVSADIIFGGIADPVAAKETIFRLKAGGGRRRKKRSSTKSKWR